MNQKPVDKNDIKSLEGRKFRFVVSSAEDAARIIKERLGENAQVLSVKQVNGKGLSRFLTSPQLEIVVTVPPQSDEVEEVVEVDEKNRLKKVFDDSALVENSDKMTQPDSVDTSVSKFEKNYPSKITDGGVQKPLDEVLKSSGFDSALVLGLKNSPSWEKINDMPIAHGLVETVQLLKDEYVQIDSCEVTNKVAFLGVPGAGTTTALCKHLSKEVFIKGKDAQVLKLENDNPNSDDALRVFCDVLGVPILKDGVNLDSIDDEKSLYLDVPGSICGDRQDWDELRSRLDDLDVDTRVLVVNAAYEADLIKEAFRLGEYVGATHLVFSHMDELRCHAKLWPFILNGGLDVLFFGRGQNITSDFSEDILEYLVQKTFPAIVAN